MENLSVLKALLLGVVQGLTEFLPVSSSAHLVLFQHLFHLTEADAVLAFDVALHFGTLLAVVAVFWRDLGRMFRETLFWVFRPSDRLIGGNAAPSASGGRGPHPPKPLALGPAEPDPRALHLAPRRYPSARLMVMVGMATLPAVVVGLGLKDPIEELFVSPRVAGVGLLVTGGVLWVTRWIRGRSGRAVSFGSALLVGFAQAVAIVPGISRSGSTIAMGLFCRWEQVFAARFSFLMSIPAILGSVVLEGRELGVLQRLHLAPLILGTVASAVTGFLAIHGLLRVIAQGRLSLFSFYCWIVGLAILILV